MIAEKLCEQDISLMGENGQASNITPPCDIKTRPKRATAPKEASTKNETDFLARKFIV